MRGGVLLSVVLLGVALPSGAEPGAHVTLLDFEYEYTLGDGASGASDVTAYVRVRNDGFSPAEGVLLTVYPVTRMASYATGLPPLPVGLSSLILPTDWEPWPAFCATLGEAPAVAAPRQLDDGSCVFGGPRLP